MRPSRSPRRRLRRLTHRRSTPTAPVLAALGALGGFAAVAALVYGGRAIRVDRAVHRAVVKRQHPRIERAAKAISPIGAPEGHGPAALLLALWLWRRTGSPAGGTAVLAASAGSRLTSVALERWIRQRPPPPGRHKPSEPSFPSGHALESAAVALTAAHVLVAERLVPPAAAVAMGLALPAVAGGGKLYRDRHWLTDVLGGWLAGGALAAAAVTAYERARRASRSVARDASYGRTTNGTLHVRSPHA
jgi:membrane-associated phospholipid phosphatase